MTADPDLGFDGLDGRLFALWASGFARRWHMSPAMSCFEDFNCAHQGRCAVLTMTLFPDHSIELLRAAVTHDSPEIKVGDLSADLKKCGGDFVERHVALEAKVLTAMGFEQTLTVVDRARLKLVDRLDAYLFVQLRHPAEAKRNGWPLARDWLRWQSKVLNCEAAMSDLLHASLMGDFR